MSLVYTIKGLIPQEQLECKDVVSWSGNARQIATEWYLNGELVRRDGWVNLLNAQSMGGEQAKI